MSGIDFSPHLSTSPYPFLKDGKNRMNEAKTKKKLAAKHRSHSLGKESSKSITKKIERYLPLYHYISGYHIAHLGYV